MTRMIIGKYIRTLLEEHKRVILPGFGNLELKQAEGAEPPLGKRISPPGTKVRFDSSFSKDDGELAGRLSAGEELDPDEAQHRVLELVDTIRFALDKGEEYFLPDAGTFTRDEDGRISFTADPSWVLEPDQYGLESMDLLELEDQPEEEQEVKPETATSIPEPVKATEPAPESKITPLASPVPKSKAKVKRWRVIWGVAALLIAILIVVILIPAQEGEEEGASRLFNRKPDPEVVEQETPAAEQQAGEQQDAGTVGQTKDVETETPDPEVVEPLPVEKTNNFFIIAGSFKSLNNASELQDQLNSRGFQAEVMITENRMYRVSVASYASKEEAEKGLRQISSEAGLGSCWLLSN